jgi:hypothetical protein
MDVVIAFAALVATFCLAVWVGRSGTGVEPIIPSLIEGFKEWREWRKNRG